MNWEMLCFFVNLFAVSCSLSIYICYFWHFYYLWPPSPLLTSPWKSIPALFMHFSCFHLPSCPLSTSPFFRPSNLSFLPSLHFSQYFDEEQDDHEYPYYYEERTSIPSSSASPFPQPGEPNQQVKWGQERGKLTEGRGNERDMLMNNKCVILWYCGSLKVFDCNFSLSYIFEASFKSVNFILSFCNPLPLISHHSVTHLIYLRIMFSLIQFDLIHPLTQD